MDLSARLWPDSTDIAMPTFCADSSLRCAVTTTSSRPPASFSDADPAGAAKLAAWIEMAAAPSAVANPLKDIRFSWTSRTPRSAGAMHHRRHTTSRELPFLSMEMHNCYRLNAARGGTD